MKTIDFFKKRTNNFPSKWDFPEFKKLTSFKLHKRNITSFQKRSIPASQKWRCNICVELLPLCFEIDHIIPIFMGGSNADINLEALCNNCHGIKTRKELNLFNIYKKRYNLTRTT